MELDDDDGSLESMEDRSDAVECGHMNSELYDAYANACTRMSLSVPLTKFTPTLPNPRNHISPPAPPHLRDTSPVDGTIHPASPGPLPDG